MSARHASTRPAWLSSTQLIWAGTGLLLLLVLLSGTFAVYQRQDTLAQETRRTQMLARLLEDETTRTLDATALALAMVSERLHGGEPAASNLSERLVEAVRGLPYMRSLSVLDTSGKVLVSSNAGAVGATFDVQLLGRPVSADDAWLGPWLPGRDLIDATRQAGMPRSLPGVGLITLVRHSTTPDGKTYLAVAALNPDYLSNHFQQILGERTLNAALLDYQGRLLAGTEGVQRLPGTSVPSHRALQEFLPEQEYGSYEGMGLDATTVVTSFRASRKHPLLVVVEESMAEVSATWRRKLGWLLVADVVGMLMIVAGTVASWRSLRAHERMAAVLDRTRNRLEESERHLRAVIEAAPAPMFVLDPLGRYVLVNQAFEDFLGVRRDDLIGQRADTDPTLSHLAYHPVRDVALWAGAGQSSYMENIVLRSGAKRQALIAKVALTRPDGRPGGVIGSITDVTSFREAEQRAADAVTASAAAHRAESEFIGNLSHALRTPLQSIIGFSELGVMRSRHDSAQHELFTHIQHGGQRMLLVVNDLLDLSQVKSATGTLHRVHVDTSDLLGEVIRHARIEARTRQIDIVVKPCADGMACVDALRFQQAARILIERAVRVSPPGSQIEARASRDSEGVLHWWIHDAGPGLAETECETMFSAFVQSRRAADDPGDGSGLELAICRQILRGLDGDVHCKNHPNGGSVCHMALPAIDPAPRVASLDKVG
ncbi:histidine kinase dimerization/phospho-acceptor domain-containing protein [Sphaerotilus sp.]|uniref:histidine kinase dimerization/phospho-acceptor domain-containing protein n=1 Tax=Sphaerotilus sp. TaxID=2093942 RepID=UPI0034E30224